MGLTDAALETPTQGESVRATPIGELPASWRIASIGDLFEVQQGKALSQAVRSGPTPRPFLRTANVLWGRFDLQTLDRMHFSDDEAKRLSLRPGDLLVCEGGEIGRTALWREAQTGYSYQNHLHRLRARSVEVDPEFVMYWMQAAFLHLNLYGGVGNQTTIPNLSASRLKQLELPQPPFLEQRAIAGVLSKLQAAVGLQDRIVATIKELKAATMAKLFREGLRGELLSHAGPGQVPQHWSVVRLAEVAQVGNGSTPKRDNPRYWANGNIPWLTSAKVHDSIIESADEFVTDAARAECHLPLVKKGSIVVAITGQGKTLGNAALVTFDTCVSQHLAYIQFQTSKVLPEFALFFLQGQYEYFRHVSHAGGSTKGALTCGFLKDYVVPCPPVEEQRQIAKALGSLAMLLKKQEAGGRALNSLFSSMLDILMTGQLRVTGLIERNPK